MNLSAGLLRNLCYEEEGVCKSGYRQRLVRRL